MSQVVTRLGYGVTGIVEADQFTRILNEQFYDDEEVRMLRNSVYEYCGVALAGSLTSDPVWTCLRQSRDINGKVCRWQIKFNVVWDNISQWIN